ncbi:uncharacterized protein LTR77_001362 [Saxophila tyrrhenica]|uniref:Epoxide hydrolase N-terminal domain-containing protein n=1 Tax=Saxophila tyrrhenica TaxID=1690608 RepID=A0AAV9PPQ8_9PEZI|nr:hypothetical protein LTR77_001362 [Saxophila tyrrhenica]
MPYDQIPSKASLKVEPFNAHVSDLQLEGLKFLLQVSPIGPETYENKVADVNSYTSFGITRSWLEEAKQHWLEKYDWRKTEDRFNTYNNYTAEIDDDNFKYNIHFIGLFSKKADAVPLLLNHGWPGSFVEFLDVLDTFKSKYDENSLPYHVIVPSLPGHAYSNGPPLDKDHTIQDTARVLDKLMVGLGFGGGYVTQGGDTGSFISRVLGATSDSVKAVHINFAVGIGPESGDEVANMSASDQKHMGRMKDFLDQGSAYARMHGTRPSTIGLVLSSSPLALLAWIGEKFEQWTDKNPPLEKILDDVTLYWFTKSLPRCIYSYRQFFGQEPQFFHNDPKYYIKKPLGYSLFPEELAPVPVSLVKKSGNLVWHREHQSGGHFAAMEKPKEFVQDIEDFITTAWTKSKM